MRTAGVEEKLLPVDPVTGEPRALSAAVLARVRPRLPVLTALSADSPFRQGRDSSYSSCRSRVRQRWPSAGPTELFGSAERRHRRVADMLATAPGCSGLLARTGSLRDVVTACVRLTRAP